MYDELLILTIKAPLELIKHLIYPGSYVFLRKNSDECLFDFPISIMDTNLINKTIKVAIQLVGVKTNRISELNIGDKILVKGPYWNGILGLNHIKSCKNKTAILICRGIGQAPVIPCLKKLKENKNKVIMVIDKGRYDEIFINDYLNIFCDEIIELPLLEKGKTPINSKQVLLDLILDKKPDLVHCDGVDILNYNIMKIVDSINEAFEEEEHIHYSCCNNAKMCCGEGVCGCCSFKTNDRVLRRMCKMQTEPKYVLGRRRIL